MAESSKTDLSALVKQLQEQVDVITAYLSSENLEGPAFVPPVDPLKPAISTLPANIEAARQKAYSLSWGLQTLLGTPASHLIMTVYQVFSAIIALTDIKVLRRRGPKDRNGEEYP